MKFPVLMILFGLLPVWGEAISRPDSGQIAKAVQALGAEASDARQAAQAELAQWSEAFPRTLLLALAEAYRKVEDVEVEIRLRELLEPLAVLHLFHSASGFLGVNMGADQLEDGRGVIFLRNVQAGLAAESAGLRTADKILSVNGRSIDALGGIGGFSEAIAGIPPGGVVELEVLRGDQAFSVRAHLGMRPPELTGGAMQLDSRQARFHAWLRELRPQSVENGIPVGHFPATP
jgi:predicted metalloprotease with PDZ domain